MIDTSGSMNSNATEGLSPEQAGGVGFGEGVQGSPPLMARREPNVTPPNVSFRARHFFFHFVLVLRNVILFKCDSLFS